MTDTLISEFVGYVPKKEAIITLQLYLELCEVKRYFDISYIFNESLNKIIIQAKKDRNGTAFLFIPITVYEEFNFIKLKQILEYTSQETVFLVMVHADSTCVYYQITDGLLEPTDIQTKHLKENKQEKIDSELKRHRNLIEQGALFGYKITIGEGKKEHKDN